MLARRRFPNAGISTMDFVVCLAMLVAFAALGLPALQHARSTAELTACQNNLRKLGEAFQSYDRDKGGFPARRTGFGSGTQPYGGWGSLLLPYVDPELNKEYHHDHDFFDPINQKVTETPIKTFLCPAAPAGRVTIIRSNASGNSANTDKDTLFTAKCGPNDYLSSNGLFMPSTGYGVGWPQELRGNDHQALTDNDNLPTSKITDGLSHTIVIIERAGAPQVWRVGKRIDKPDLFAMANNARGAWAGWGSLNYGAFDSKDGESPAKGDATDCTVNCNNFFGIYGFHADGANILLCDGSVRFVGKKLDGLTLARLTTRDDAQLLDLDSF